MRGWLFFHNGVDGVHPESWEVRRFVDAGAQRDIVTSIPGVGANDLHVSTGGGIESDFQLMELVNHTNVAANDLVDHFTLQGGHEIGGVNAAAHLDLFMSSRDLLSGLDTTGPGSHQIVTDYALLQA